MNQENRKEEELSNQKPKHMAWYVVAFLDLLGQQDVLRKMTALPNVENQKEMVAFKQKVAELYRPLYGLQSFFKAGIKPFIEGGGLDETAFPPLQQEILKQFRSTPVSYRHFSDSLIVHIPIRNDVGRFQCHAIYGVLAATAVTFLSCLVHSWAIRGGIELGLAMDIEEGEVYGPALARAYRLESKVAQYPRIVIGKELVQYLEMVVRQGQERTTDAEVVAHAGFANRAIGLLAVDDDGCTILDWLGNDIRTTFQQHRELILTAYRFIIQECNKYKEARDSKLGFRYALLRTYVESRLPEWGISLQSE